MASLDGPRAKIKRAKKHIDEFEGAVGGLVFSHSQHPHVIGTEHDPETGNKLYKLIQIPEVPCDVAPIAADAIHNLRTVFDLLMGQLVERATNTPPGKGTPGFRYGETAEGFEANFTPEVKALVGEDAVDCIRATEPYPGGKGEAVWYLHHLDVADKHRVVYDLGFHMGKTTLAMPGFPTEDSPFSPEEIAEHNKMLGEAMDSLFWNLTEPLFPLKAGDVLQSGPPEPINDPKFPFDIAFAEPEIVHAKPVLPTLAEYLQATEGLLDAFAPLF